MWRNVFNSFEGTNEIYTVHFEEKKDLSYVYMNAYELVNFVFNKMHLLVFAKFFSKLRDICFDGLFLHLLQQKVFCLNSTTKSLFGVLHCSESVF